MKMIRTLIAEDEAPARQWLRSLCARHRDLTLVGECASVSEASQKLRSIAVDLLLLDIHLGPHLGFRVLDGVPASSVPLVIVVTAHDRYAVRAFEKNAVDYLLKPVSEDRLAMALDRARRRLHAGLTSEMRAEIQAALAPLHELLLRGAETAPAPRLIAEGQGVLHVLDPREIELIESDGNYLKMHTPGGCYTTRSTMQAMEESLAAHLFIRLSRSVMVNTAFVARIERDADSVYEFVMRNGRNVKVGRSYRQPIAELIRTQGLLTAAAARG